VGHYYGTRVVVLVFCCHLRVRRREARRIEQDEMPGDRYVCMEQCRHDDVILYATGFFDLEVSDVISLLFPEEKNTPAGDLLFHLFLSFILLRYGEQSFVFRLSAALLLYYLSTTSTRGY
jgi:hypothetical protein